MKIRLCIALILCLGSSLLKAQHDAMYSQYMFNALLINPAYAGSCDALELTALNRMQWVGFDGAPQTSTFSAHTPLRNNKINLGITFTDDRFGLSHQNKLNLIYAYRIQLKQGALFLGLQAGLNLLRTNYSQVSTTSSGDQVFSGPDMHSTSPEAGFGIYYRTQRLYAGLSAPSLYPDHTGESLREHPWLLTGGYVYDLPSEFKLKPSLLIKYIPASPVEVDLNLTAYYKSFGLGFSYRTNDAIACLLEFNINDQLKAGYAYDLLLSRLGTYSRGSHEIMLKYEFGYTVKAKNPRYF
jgi:type IX secretion system PorP/SprF family membrane protein